MRITGGGARGIPVKSGKGDLRPATDRSREAVFSSLGPVVEGAAFVDFFAGTGAYGLEALSRGATGGTFVDANAKHLALARQNLAAVAKSLGSEELVCEFAEATLPKGATRFGKTADVVFLDPPYEVAERELPRLLEMAAATLRDDGAGIVIFELPAHLEVPPDCGLLLKRRIGKTKKRNQPSVAILKRDLNV